MVNVRRDIDPSLYKLPPQNIEAEQTVLGVMIEDNETIVEVRKVLLSTDFYNEAHRKIFVAISETFEDLKKVDLVILNDVLKRKNGLDSVGGSTYIASLVDNLASSANLSHYLKIIKHKAILRQIILGCSDTIDDAYDGSNSLEEILAKWQRLQGELIGRLATDEDDHHLIFSADELYGDAASYCETPFETLNDSLGGMFSGEIIIIGGRPGMGKSALAHNCLRHTAISNAKPVVYFAAQMDKKRIYQRLLSAMCKIPFTKIQRGSVDKDDWIKLEEARAIIDAAPIDEYIIEKEIDVISLEAQARRFADKRGGSGLIIVENIQQVIYPGKKFDGRNKDEIRKEELKAIISVMRAFGIELKVPLLISSQLNREVEKTDDKHPEMAFLKGAGEIEDIADKIIFPFRPNVYKKEKITGPEQAEIIIAKGGEPGSLPFKFWGKYLYWEEG